MNITNHLIKVSSEHSHITDSLFIDGQRLDSVIESILSSINIYDIFKCSICGISWLDHSQSCLYHHKKPYFDSLRRYALKQPQYKKYFDLAKRNGYDETDDQLFEHTDENGFVCDFGEIVQ